MHSSESVLLTSQCSIFFFADIKCEMDSLECQRIRKLTDLYYRLKSPVPSIERIEYITELADVLRTEPHSPILTEVTNHLLHIRSRMFANTLLFVFFLLTAYRFAGQRAKTADCKH